MKVLLDTNVLFAAFIASGLCEEVFELCVYRHELFSSPALMSEFEEVLRRKGGLPPALTESIKFRVVGAHQIVDPIMPKAQVCRDADDDQVLGAAAAARVDAIVTGDQDLLELREYQGMPILNPRQFLKRDAPFGRRGT